MPCKSAFSRSGCLVVSCKPLAVAPALVRRDGRVQAAGRPADHVRLGVIEQHLDEMTGVGDTIGQVADQVTLRGTVKGTARLVVVADQYVVQPGQVGYAHGRSACEGGEVGVRAVPDRMDDLVRSLELRGVPGLVQQLEPGRGDRGGVGKTEPRASGTVAADLAASPVRASAVRGKPAGAAVTPVTVRHRDFHRTVRGACPAAAMTMIDIDPATTMRASGWRCLVGRSCHRSARHSQPIGGPRRPHHSQP